MYESLKYASLNKGTHQIVQDSSFDTLNPAVWINLAAKHAQLSSLIEELKSWQASIYSTATFAQSSVLNF